MSQAPTGITQTINRIVERTVEKVVTEPAKSVAAAVGVTPTPAPAPVASKTETTVVVKEDDLAADSIAKVQGSMVKIIEKGASESTFYARGIIVDASGAIATDKYRIDPNQASEAIFPDGARIPITPRPSVPGISVLIFDPNFIATTTPKYSAAKLADLSKLRLGQAVIRIGGKGRDSVSNGVIASLPDASQEGEHLVETNITSTMPGAVLLTIFGDVIGLTTGTSLQSANTTYTPATSITTALNSKK